MSHYTMKQKIVLTCVAIPVTFIILGIIAFIIDNNPLLRQIVDLLGHVCVMSFLGGTAGYFIGKWIWERAYDMNLYNIEEGIDRTLIGGAAILSILSILLLIGLLIGLFGLLTFVCILLGLGVFLFLSYWVGKWFIG